MPAKVGRPVERSLRKRIRELLKSGSPQAEIARILDKAPSTIAHHVKALGHKPKKYGTPATVGKDGKRRCVQCGKRKFPGSFPSERNASCSMCVRGLTD
jgi:IS30 family transposase